MDAKRHRRQKERDLEWLHTGKPAPNPQRVGRQPVNVSPPSPEYEFVEDGQCEYCGIKNVKRVAVRATASRDNDDFSTFSVFFSLSSSSKRSASICRMCFDMTKPLVDNDHFKRAQAEWEAEQKKIRRILNEIGS